MASAAVHPSAASAVSKAVDVSAPRGALRRGNALLPAMHADRLPISKVTDAVNFE